MRTQESGFILIALVATVFPLLFVIGAMTTVFSGRNSQLLSEIRREKALLAAESGIDEAIYRASTAIGLTSGTMFERDMGQGMGYSVLPTYLKTDGVDNDNDGQTDEADENVFQLTVTGTYGGTTTRKVSAYLGPTTTSGTAQSALGMQNAGAAITIKNGCLISGVDTLMTGAPGNPANDVLGLAIDAPGTAADVLAKLNGNEPNLVLGQGGSPSVGVAATPTDINDKILDVQNSANIVLTSSEYSNYQFGSGPGGQFNIIYRNGNLTLKNGSQGAGILAVTGDLMTEGTVRFDGIIYVLGHVEIHGNTTFYGSMLTGPSSEHVTLEGTTKIIYSADAVSQASSSSPGKFNAFNGWQELSRY